MSIRLAESGDHRMSILSSGWRSTSCGGGQGAIHMLLRCRKVSFNSTIRSVRYMAVEFEVGISANDTLAKGNFSFNRVTICLVCLARVCIGVLVRTSWVPTDKSTFRILESVVCFGLLLSMAVIWGILRPEKAWISIFREGCEWSWWRYNLQRSMSLCCPVAPWFSNVRCVWQLVRGPRPDIHNGGRDLAFHQGAIRHYHWETYTHLSPGRWYLHTWPLYARLYV